MYWQAGTAFHPLVEYRCADWEPNWSSIFVSSGRKWLVFKLFSGAEFLLQRFEEHVQRRDTRFT
jgi:hypothetical protein